MKKLVAYITASLPDKEFTIDLALKLKESGVDTLELGVPFSDPVADGPVIESANLKSLERGFKLDDIFYISDKIGREIDTLWMGYFNSFYHRGFDLFVEKAKASGVNGFIIPDLPYNEAIEYDKTMKANGLSLISFVAPTDSESRIKDIVSDSTKFIYLVAYAGITGAAKSEDLSGVIENIRKYSNTPVYLGFGVNAQNAKEKAEIVDGVIVGSAFVKILDDDNLTNSEKMITIAALAKEIKEKINS